MSEIAVANGTFSSPGNSFLAAKLASKKSSSLSTTIKASFILSRILAFARGKSCIKFSLKIENANNKDDPAIAIGLKSYP